MASPAPLSYLDKAVSGLRAIGLNLRDEGAALPAVQLASQLSDVDNNRIMVICRVLQQGGAFNAMAREQVAKSTVTERYRPMVSAFDSILQDSQRQAARLDSGEASGIGAKVGDLTMRLTRGSIPARFDKIRKLYLEVSKDAGEDIKRMEGILNAYMDYRLSLKQAEVLAFEVLERMTAILDAAKAAVQTAQAKVDALPADVTGAERGTLELARDEAIRFMKHEDERYQLAKDLAENLRIGYATSDVVMARVSQTTEIRKRVYNQAVTFFATNETVFTGLTVGHNSQASLNEETETLNAMTEGIGRGLEALGEEGDKALRAGVKAGYGPTIKAEQMKKLADAVLSFQEAAITEIEAARKESTDNAEEIRKINEETAARYAAMATRVQAVEAKAESAGG